MTLSQYYARKSKKASVTRDVNREKISLQQSKRKTVSVAKDIKR